MIRYTMGKKCTLCGVPVDNRTKVLTCQKCRHKQAKQREIVLDKPNATE